VRIQVQESWTQTCLQQSGLLQRRPPLQPAHSGNTQYTLAPYQVTLQTMRRAHNSSHHTNAREPQQSVGMPHALAFATLFWGPRFGAQKHLTRPG
jgi:hypothetical protein